MNPDEAAQLYLKRIEMKIPMFETMDEKELNFIKMINAGEKFFYNNVSFNYLSHRIVFYLTNLHIKSRTTYFVRAGVTTEEDSYKADAPLSEQGKMYAKKMSDTLLRHREQEKAALAAQGGPDIPLRPLSVWSSTRLRTIQTAEYLKEMGFKVRQRSQMSQINPGVCERMPERAIRHLYPDEVEKHGLDPYHHRYPRAEVSCSACVRLSRVTAVNQSSLTTISRFASSPSFSSWSESRMISLSSRTNQSCVFSTLISCTAVPWTSRRSSSRATRLSRSFPPPTRMKPSAFTSLALTLRSYRAPLRISESRFPRAVPAVAL
jgi:broad specificity phosphatase PhoE